MIDPGRLRKARMMIENQHLAEQLAKKQLTGSLAAFKLQLLAMNSNMAANELISRNS